MFFLKKYCLNKYIWNLIRGVVFNGSRLSRGGLLYMECQCLDWLQRCLQYDLEILLPYLALWIRTSQPVLFMEQEIVTLADPLVTLLFFLWELCCACFCSCLRYVHLACIIALSLCCCFFVSGLSLISLDWGTLRSSNIQIPLFPYKFNSFSYTFKSFPYTLWYYYILMV